MRSLAWTVNRLRLMNAPEIAWRIGKAIRHNIEAHRPHRRKESPAVEAWGRNWIDVEVTLPDAARYVRAADAILAGHYDVFALRGVQLGFPPEWNRDPKTGAIAPLSFGKTLDYRDERVVGNIKYLWEINRHYELVTLAQAWRLSGDARYAEACRTMLMSWFDACPHPFGQAWSSSLENAIRLVNWSVAWQLLGGGDGAIFAGAAGQRFRRQWLASIHEHCAFIAGDLSFHSSANNHLFGEYMGLFIATVTWPCWPQSGAWLARAHEGLEREAMVQNAGDGVNREQGIWYHHEVADMMLLCLLAGRANGAASSDAFLQRLTAMLEFIMSVMDAGGNVPMIGDADDAVMVRFSQEPGFHPYRSLLAAGAVLFKRPDFKAAAGRFDDKNRWLFGNAGSRDYARLNERHACGVHSARPLRRAFPEGGYYVLGADIGTAGEVMIVADAGPLGYLSIAAHGHADALSLTLSASGMPLLIDPGTFAYHTERRWRDYFRGTSAHNTVRVDGCDQSESGGNFMWLRKADTTVESWSTSDEADVLVARHDGYARLPDPVVHRRRIVLRKRERVVIVEDTLECRQTHEVEWFWHLADACRIEIGGRTVTAIRGPARLTLTQPESAVAPAIVCGRDNPPLGWMSTRFDERTPAPTIFWKERITGTARRTTVLHIEIAHMPEDGAHTDAEEACPHSIAP